MREAVASIVQELATAEPGKDIGLLPINSFVCDLEDPALLASLPAPMPEAVQCARLWIDQTLDSTARFDVQTLQRFQEWTLWMEAAMDAVSGSSSVPALPEAWRNPSRQAFSVSSQVAALAQSVAREISTAEVGKDAGLLPVNSFLCEIEEVLSRADLPAVIEEAVRLAREWVDHILDTTAVFDAGTLALFSEWVVWIDAALEQNETAELSLTIPPAWKDVARSGTPVAEAEGGARAGNTLGALAGLVRQLSLELAFTEEGKDTGLLPINSFLTQMRELLPSAGFPNAVSEALVQASAWLDALFDTTAQFDTWTIARLSEWAAWMDTALERLGSSQPLPEWPAAWANRTKSGGEKSPVAPEGGGLVSEAPVPVSSVRSTPSVEDAPVAVSFGATHAGAYSKGEESAGFPAEPPLALPLEGDDRDLIVGFISESYEHLQNIEQGVLVLEENPTDSATLNSIFRAFHTFKGGAGCCNLTPIKDLAHELESVLDAARQHRLALTTEIINAILEGGDTLGKFVAQIADRLAGKDLSVPICIPTLPLIARAQRILRGESGPEIVSVPAEPPNSLGARDADRSVAPSEPEAAQPSQSRPASGASASAGKPTGASAEVPPLPGGAAGARAAGASGGAAAPAA
ncbi:MAG: hypothetical protein RLZZ244_2844, partial [Verrucomicrobiota bacterium]